MADYNLPLPDSIKAMAEQSPVEDTIIYAIRHFLPDLPFGATVPNDPPDFFGIVRASNPLGNVYGDPRFVQFSNFEIETFTRGPTGDEAGAVVSEAIRVALRKTWLPQPLIVPGRGHFIKIEETIKPARKSDWATSAGPVQYADLPSEYWRYEAAYRMTFRVYPNKPFLLQ